MVSGTLPGAMGFAVEAARWYPSGMNMRWVIAIGVAALLGVAAWWVWPRDGAEDAKAPPRPSEVRGQGGGEVTVRPKAVPAAVTRVEAPRPDVSRLVKVAIGRDEATARRYVVRSEAVARLGEDLPEEAVEALLGYLRAAGDVLREERVDALKNDIMNVLRAQKRVSPKVAETLVAMFDSQAYGVAMLDYCVQHLGALQEATADAAERERIQACLRRAALVPGASYAGTALIALTHTPNADDDLRHFVNERALALVCAEDTHEAARVTAVQIAAERGCAEALPVIRRIAADASAPVTLRIAAIGALGTFRQADDVALLERLRVAPNARLSPAIERALKRCRNKEEP